MYDYCFLALLLAVAVLVCLNWGPYETTTAKATESSKSNWLRLAKQQLCTCITLFCTFLCRPCTTTMWNDQILSLLGNGNGKAINSTISVWTRVPSPLFSSNPSSLLLSNRTPRDNREKKWKDAKSVFQRRFRGRRRCRIVRSLLPIVVIQKFCYHCNVTSHFCVFVSILFNFLPSVPPFPFNVLFTPVILFSGYFFFFTQFGSSSLWETAHRPLP